MARFDTVKVPPGMTRKWEIVIQEDGTDGREVRRTAADVKHEHRVLRDIPADELRTLPLLPAGARLERGHWYLDLHNPARGEFRGNDRDAVRPGQRVLARGDAPTDLWRRLLDASEAVLGHGRRRSHAA